MRFPVYQVNSSILKSFCGKFKKHYFTYRFLYGNKGKLVKLNDLAVFVEVAKAPSLREAAKQMEMQPGTVSKLIKRIEAYYQQKLFSKQGTQWVLTEAGDMLFQRAIEMLVINQKIERELGKPRRPHLRISGSEAVLGYFVPNVIERLLSHNHDVTLETKNAQDLTLLNKHEVDIALVSSLSGFPPRERQTRTIELSQANFVTVANQEHILFLKQSEEAVPIDELLQYPFVVPSKPIYGSMDIHRSLDGWHDEEFSRLISARVDTISTLIALVKHKPFLAYVPDYVAREHGLKVITVSGCPYSCEQTIWLCRHSEVQHYFLHVFDNMP
ncbi:LysR family transcriptional regulator [Vibrio sinaloensis]|uniref:LysR family transcriptional regulator n=1 Tax=Photobacterium sp. (strain ATCC 43367) TaxID=379097 RepID=UPI00204DAA54|nr:LysR family transcriptional regulator [Vibrio sinaloensis]UPQ89820.1 LysR family transcriptional regulator [Vibrio sinaloensis]